MVTQVLKIGIRAFPVACAWLAAAAACSPESVVAIDGGDAPDRPVDAADGPVDAPVDAPAVQIDAAARCAPGTPWGTPRLLLSLNTPGNEIYGRLTADELTLFGRVADTELTISTRSSTAATFPVGTPLDLGQSTMTFSSPTATGDGLTLYFLAGPRIWRAHRTSRTSPFTDVGPVPELAAAADATTIYVLPDESALYISTSVASQQILRAARAGGVFATPVAVAGVVGTSPVVSADELTIVFSTRTFSPVATNSIWMGTRPSTAVPFGSIAEVPSLDSPSLDDPSWLSPDDCRLYLRSVRPGGSGGYDLYIAERSL